MRPGRPEDLLRWPLLGPILRWRHLRTLLQALLLVLAILIILDGLFGPQLASRNLAGLLPWVHWRGFVVLALLVAGNLFCMACPFMLPRRLAKRFLPARRSWPPALQSKWLAVGLLALFFWAYEAFALWESPWLTAWVVVVYFVGAFLVDGFFKGASFCRFVCPIGQFHFVHSTLSPLEVRVRDPSVCRSCETKDCIRGRYDPSRAPVPASAGEEENWEGRPIRPSGPGGSLEVAAAGRSLGREGLLQSGCELALYQPRKEGNLDCTFCLECIHACPHDNVGILIRRPGRELTLDPVRSGVGRISHRPDLGALALLLVFAAFVNALGMVEPLYRLQDWAGGVLGSGSRELIVAGTFLVGLFILPGLLVGGAAWGSRRAGRGGGSVVREASRFAWALVPVGLAMWTAHYLFHLWVGALTLLPVGQDYLRELGLPSGPAVQGVGSLIPEHWIFPLQLLLLQGGLLLSLMVGYRIARRERGSKGAALRSFLPWAALATALVLAGTWILTQPMEMRGTGIAL